jgi:hypothetical protein
MYRSSWVGLLCAALLPVGVAAQDGLSTEYLKGAWSMDGPAGCTSPELPRIRFEGDGTFSVHVGARADAVGFWSLVGDVLDLHLIAAPQVTGRTVAGVDASYSYGFHQANVSGVQPNEFLTVSGGGPNLGRRTFTRCP